MTPRTAPALSSARQRVFRLAAAGLAPLLFLLLLEGVLRLVGYGYPTGFFIPSPSRQPDLFTENPKFGWRYFPQRLARAPEPTRLTKTKAPGTCRIFVFGESAAL